MMWSPQPLDLVSTTTHDDGEMVYRSNAIDPTHLGGGPIGRDGGRLGHGLGGEGDTPTVRFQEAGG